MSDSSEINEADAVPANVPKVLIVDDSPENREYVCRLLRKIEVALVEASAGDKAVSVFEEQSPEDFALILMDINMPGMDGYETVSMIKAISGADEIPIIFVTGEADHTHEKWGYDYGAVDYIVRPINAHALVSKVKIFLELYARRHKAQELVEQLEKEIAEKERLETEHIKREKQLWQSQKMESLGTMAGGLAHEFNNIFSSMLGHTELLKCKLGEEYEGYVHIDRIGTGISRATQLVKQMTSFSQLDSFDPEPLLVEDLVEESFELLRTMLPASVLLYKSIEPNSGCVNVDKAGMFQILMNLGGNAVDSMENQRGILELDVRSFEVDEATANLRPNLKEGSYVAIMFKDNGSGMSEEVFERAFDPFYTTKRTQVNSGLGLSVVHGIVREHAGDVEIQSEAEVGTSVTVYLPKVSDISLPTEENAEFFDPEAAEGTARILLVDDNEMTLEAARLVLEARGYEIIALTDGVKALDMMTVSPDSFDMIITDQIMPHINGVELVQQLRVIKPDIPIILFSGYNDVINKDNYWEFDVDAYLPKPYSIQEITTAIEKTLASKREK